MNLHEIWQRVNKRYWDACENFEKNTSIPVFSKFVTPLELKGIPSLPVLLAFILLVISAASFLVLQSTTSSGTFTIHVISQEGEPVDGVAVTLTSQDTGVNQTVTSINGVAEFILPVGKRYLVHFESEFEPSIDVVVAQAGKTQQIRLLSRQVSASVFVFVENTAGFPVSGAQVEYNFDDSVKRSSTNSSGYVALFASPNATINVTITAPTYERASIFFDSGKIKVAKVTLFEQLLGKAANLNLLALQRSRVSSPLNYTAATGTVKVNVKQLSDNGFQPVSNAFVALYNGFSKTLIAESRSSANGVAEFRNIPTANDFNVYAVVEVDGFLTTVSDQIKFDNSLEFEVIIARANGNNSVDLLVKLTDESGSPAKGDVYVVSTQGAVLAKRLNTNNQVVIRNLPKERVYVAVTSLHYSRFVSPLLNPEVGQYVALLKIANSSNVGNVTVITTDFNNNKVAQAAVNLFLSTTLSPPEVKTNSQGTAVFSNVPLGIPVTIKGEKNSFVGQSTFTLSANAANTNQTIVLKPPTGTVALSVVDFSTNQPLIDPQVKVFYKATPTELIELPSNCTISAVSPSCTLSLISSVTYVATATLNGFHSSSVEFEATPFQHTGIRVKMFPNSFTQQVEFLGVFDALDATPLEEGEPMSVGKVYSAKFAIRTNKELSAATNYGLYVRLGESSQGFTSNNLPAGIAFISPEFSPSSSLFYSQFANASKTYSEGTCTSSIDESGIGLYKWVFAGGEPSLAPAEYVETVVPIAAISPGVTKLEYFTLTTFATEQQNEVQRVIRFPSDIELGEAYSTNSKQWCNSRTRSVPLVVEEQDNTKCNAFACIKTWVTQGDASFFDSAIAESTEATRNNLEVHYKIIDFLQTPTPLLFSPSIDTLKLDATHTNPVAAVNTGENTYANTLTTFSTEGSISTIVQSHRANENIRLQFGQKIYSDISLEVLAPPEPPVDLGDLGSRYEVSYDAQSDSFKLLDETGQNVEAIEMYSDPILPADAVFVYFNYSSSPCQSGENNFQYLLEDSLTCFDIADAPSEFLTSTPHPGLKLIKYDASTPSCGAYAVDLNKVNEANAKLTVQNSCSPARKDFDIQVKVQREIAEDSQDQYKALLSQVTYSEPTDDLGEENPFSEVPHSLWALLVNRQHGSQSSVNIGGSNGYLYDDEGGQIISHEVGSTKVKSALAGSDGKNFKNELGAVTPPYAMQLFTTGVKNKQLTPSDFENIKNQVKIIAENTAFRRSPDGCDVDPNCKLKEFPYRLFEPNKEFSFQLGSAYLGTNKEHKVNFESVEASGKDDQGKAMQGVYSISIDYKHSEAGGYQWVPTATALSIGQVDYYNGACGQDATQLAFPGAMSWRGTSCLQTCGDGTYFDLESQDTGRICDGNTFTVSKFETAVSEMKIIKLAAELGACYAVGCGATLTCSIIAQRACEAALIAQTSACGTSFNPISAAACTAATAEVVTACHPKASECAFTAGLAAVGGTLIIQQVLESPVTTCDLVSQGVIGAAGALVNYGVIGAYFIPLKTICTVSIPASAPIVGTDSAAGAEVVSGACNALVGVRFLGLLSSWIANGATDNSALPDRTYVDISGKTCTSWHSNLGSYFVYQDCNFKSLWAREGRIETCDDASNVKLFTKKLSYDDGKITFKIKS